MVKLEANFKPKLVQTYFLKQLFSDTHYWIRKFCMGPFILWLIYGYEFVSLWITNDYNTKCSAQGQFMVNLGSF